MKSNMYLDKTANVFMALGLCGVIYKIVTNKVNAKTMNKIVTTYNTMKMWKWMR